MRRQKESGQKKLYGALIIVDDYADDSSIVHKQSGRSGRLLGKAVGGLVESDPWPTGCWL